MTFIIKNFVKTKAEQRTDKKQEILWQIFQNLGWTSQVNNSPLSTLQHSFSLLLLGYAYFLK